MAMSSSTKSILASLVGMACMAAAVLYAQRVLRDNKVNWALEHPAPMTGDAIPDAGQGGAAPAPPPQAP
ncbi:MAG: hypothetical protein PHU21_14615 [Elusimicrobia bacterium]|nr:hypothetical protein [Elusimicrobiota bacterium]